MIDWSLEGICRAPDECLVAEYGTCAHGLVSWRIVLDDLADHDAANHGAADHGAGNHDVTDHAADRVARPD